MKQLDKQSLINWEAYRQSIIRATPVIVETVAQKTARLISYQTDYEAAFKYYFQNDYKSEPAVFHRRASIRILNNPEWYEVRAWSRELAKSTRTMFEILFLALNIKKRNIILVSNSLDNAKRLLAPYRIHLESNRRIINDFGLQKGLSTWTDDEFITSSGVSFRALGAGQSPRGAKNDSVRPDALLIDDIDTDEDCRNPEIIDKKWKWVEKALIPTRSISEKLLVLFCGNVIAEYCCITEAMKKANFVEIINIRDENGKSSWPSKNTEEMIDRALSIISFSAAQGEYFNNPITEGKVFKDLIWGKVPQLHKFEYLIAYGDPSPSNKETSKGSYKTIPLVGRHENKFYILKVFLEQTTNSKFVEWYYNLRAYVANKCPIQNYVENNTLQDPFFEQVFKPLFFQKAKETGHLITIRGDDRKKPDKYTRIEGTLEPINRLGCLIFNEDEKNNPHMQRLQEQFKAVSPTTKHLIDGPDAVEGAVFILNNNLLSVPVTIGKRGIGNFKNKKRM